MGQLIDSERAEIAAHLEGTMRGVVDLAAGLDSEQWTWKPSDGVWSTSECAEHILIVERILLSRIDALLAAKALDPERAAKTVGKEKKFVERIPARTIRVTAPEQMRPTGRFADPGAFFPEFEAVRERTLRVARESQAPLHHLVDAHFALGDLTGAQWLWFISAHCERHVNQMREIRESPGFPAVTPK